ncbi:GerMN domain-containing protein [Amnibacterium sp.]|uniref:GerMN domain-containing protein n=1 Tax=Amnibacterium sp. TaxID=1872496 RepID=UPI00261FE7CE|nr:GerMN domain-containing protein [Amnibacterium sp.]MCU1472072.1 lpqB [Amnibacterium sp.]
MRRWWAALLAAACVLVLAGCADIPTSGDVKVGQTQDVKNQDVVLVPYPPAQGEAPADIVQGFLTAATGQQHSYRVARDFLTPALAKTWNPDARVLIHDQPWQVKAVSETSIVVTVPATAEVNAEGVYTGYAAPRDRPVPFTLAKVNGQWRIAKTPGGIVLGTNYFGSLFTARPAYYFDPRWSQTVPDLRWFPARNITPLRVVQALLAGPAAPIAPPVTTSAFPHGTTVSSVQVASGVATVDLDTGSELPSLTAVTRMRAQLEDSLLNLKGIQQVQVSVGGHVEHAPTLPPTAAPPLSALVLRKGVVGTIAGSDFKPERTLGRQIAATGPQGGTVSLSRGFAAVRTPSGIEVVTAGATRVVDSRPGLIDPTLDDRGWTYSVPQADPNSWRAVDARGHVVSVAVTMQDVTSIIAIEASRDGTRMLVLASTDRGPIAFVAGIVRDTSGVPLALTSQHYDVDVPASTTALDATWVDAAGSSVAVLAQDDTGDDVTVQQLGGLPSSVGRLSMADTLVGATSLKDLRARLQNGSIAELSGAVWSTDPSVAADVLFVQR